MIALVPFRIEAIFLRPPIANRILFGTTIAVSLLALYGPDAPWDALVLASGNAFGLPGHLLLHADLEHLAGNMLILWVFGNAVCANMGNLRYATLYLLVGTFAGLIHMIFDGNPAIGASGAINGVVGSVLAVYPRDRVDVFWWLFIRFGVTTIPVWSLAAIWLALDLLGLLGGDSDIAHWAHLGGLVTGIVVGLIGLQSGWFRLTEFDRPTLLELWRERRR